MEGSAHEAIRQAQPGLAETPAKTLAGLIFKARYAATHYRTEYDDEVMASIVADLLAMADDPGASPRRERAIPRQGVGQLRTAV